MGEVQYDAEPEPVTFEGYEQDVLASGDIGALTRLYRQAYDDAEELAKAAMKAKSKKERLAEELCTRLLTEGLTSVRNELGSFAAKIDNMCSINPGKDEEVFSDLESIGLGGVIKRKVEWQTLNKLYREGQINGILNEENFKTWTRKGISIRRAS